MASEHNEEATMYRQHDATTINLGDRVRDRVSGITGIATGRANHLNKCVQFCIEPLDAIATWRAAIAWEIAAAERAAYERAIAACEATTRDLQRYAAHAPDRAVADRYGHGADGAQACVVALTLAAEGGR